MGCCLGLVVLAWGLVRLYSVTVAVVMSVVAMAIPPVAVMVANAGDESRDQVGDDRGHDDGSGKLRRGIRTPAQLPFVKLAGQPVAIRTIDRRRKARGPAASIPAGPLAFMAAGGKRSAAESPAGSDPRLMQGQAG
jgi:hypothetical protein